MNSDFETFAKEFSEYFMRNYMLPWMKQHGVIMGYRAKILSKTDDPKQMTVQRLYDNTTLTIPYANSAPYAYYPEDQDIPEGAYCLVLCVGDSSNCVVLADSQFNLFPQYDFTGLVN